MNGSGADVKRLWHEICRHIYATSETAYDLYFKGIVPLQCDAQSLKLGVSEEYFADCIMFCCADLLQDAVTAVCGEKRKIEFEYGYLPENGTETAASVSGMESAVSAEDDTVQTVAETVAPVSCNIPAQPVRRTAEKCMEEHTFDNFVVGEENRYAYAAATTFAQGNHAQGLLYIYGGSGMGKTHLIQAVANEMATKNPKAVIRYTTCEDFLNEYVASLKSHTDFRFRDRFRNVDLLLVDDIHFLGGKAQIQEEFFNTFNALINSRKQIILTSDKPPAEIRGLEKRLLTRFQSGLTMQITSSTFETRLSILRKMQENMTEQNRIPDDVLTFLASRICSNMRPLKSALYNLAIYAKLGMEISVLHAEELLADVLDKEAEERSVYLSVDAIQKAVADYFELQVRDLVGSKRPANIAEPRMLAMYLCRKLTDVSQQEIGQAFGGRSHATVIHAIKQVEKKAGESESMRHVISSIQRSLQYGS